MRKISSSLAILAFTALSTPTLADTPNWLENVYIFGTAGRSDMDSDEKIDPLYKVDDSDTTFALGAGYQINENFSAELGYTDLGELSVKTDDGRKGSLDITGYLLGLKGAMMVTDDISLLARTGVLFWDVDTKSLSGRSSSTDGKDLYLTVGAAYHFTEQLAVDWQYSRYFMEDDDNNDLDIDTVTLGMTYHF